MAGERVQLLGSERGAEEFRVPVVRVTWDEAALDPNLRRRLCCQSVNTLTLYALEKISSKWSLNWSNERF